MNEWDNSGIPPLVSPSGAFDGRMHTGASGSFPRRAGTPFPVGAGQFGTVNGAGGGQFHGEDDPWGSEGGFAGEYSGGMTSAPNGHPYANQSMAPGAGPYGYPSTSFAPQNGYDNSYYAALHQQAMSAPPDTVYIPPPPWAAANTGIVPYVQQPSPWSSMALTRPRSSMSVRSNPYMPYAGTSFNSNSPVSTLGRSPKTYGYNGGLPDRPSEWRKDFSMRSGLSSLLPRQRSVSYDHSAHPRSQLHRFIRYTYNDAPVSYDLRLHPMTLSFRDVPRNILSSDLTRFACEPPLPYMRLYHPRLPWYIDVHASNPTGVNMGDLFISIWSSLRWQIQKSDFWNDELNDADRAKVSHAWSTRCNGDIMEQKAGVRRVDFLRRHVIFEGLVKGRNGMWEMKTRKVAYPE